MGIKLIRGLGVNAICTQSCLLGAQMSHIQNDRAWESQDLCCAIAVHARILHALYSLVKLSKLGIGLGLLCPMNLIVYLNPSPLWLVEQSEHCSYFNHDIIYFQLFYSYS